MYTFLPEQNIKIAQREYHVRVLILFLFCLSAAIWIGIASLFPSYIISLMQERGAVNHLQTVRNTTQTPISASVAAQVAAANANINLIKNSVDPVVFSSIVETIVNQRIPGISINDIEIAHTPVASNPAATAIAVRGTATTRDVLVAFQHALSGNPSFSQVNLPISDLARSTNVPFSITFTGLH